MGPHTMSILPYISRTSLFFSLYLSLVCSLSSLNQHSKALLFSATTWFISSFHHSLPFLLLPPTFLIPHTSFAHLSIPSLKRFHSASTPSLSLLLLKKSCKR